MIFPTPCVCYGDPQDFRIGGCKRVGVKKSAERSCCIARKRKSANLDSCKISNYRNIYSKGAANNLIVSDIIGFINISGNSILNRLRSFLLEEGVYLWVRNNLSDLAYWSAKAQRPDYIQPG
jgi:hypothetical protein